MSCATTAASLNAPLRSSPPRTPCPRHGMTCKPGSTPCWLSRKTGRGRPAPDPIRPHDVRDLTAGELERARRELRASLALVRPDSPARVPIQAHMSAIETELAERAAGGATVGHRAAP